MTQAHSQDCAEVNRLKPFSVDFQKDYMVIFQEMASKYLDIPTVGNKQKASFKVYFFTHLPLQSWGPLISYPLNKKPL